MGSIQSRAMTARFIAALGVDGFQVAAIEDRGGGAKELIGDVARAIAIRRFEVTPISGRQLRQAPPGSWIKDETRQPSWLRSWIATGHETMFVIDADGAGEDADIAEIVHAISSQADPNHSNAVIVVGRRPLDELVRAMGEGVSPHAIVHG